MFKSKNKRHDLSNIKMQEIKEQGFGAIYVTESFVNDINKIYGNFTPRDNEYPALGVTIAEAPIFVECLKYPDEAIIRRRMTDEVIGSHPSIVSMWNTILEKYQGRCRYTSVHIHPMDLPRPSSVDINNYERVRRDTSAFNTFEGDKPFPFILINLHGGKLQLLGFWVMNGECYKCEIIDLADHHAKVKSAWETAPPLAYYSEESKCVRKVQNSISSKWTVSLAVRNGTNEKAMKVNDDQGNRFILGFDKNKVLGLSNPFLNNGKIIIEEFINWEILFDELADATKALSLEKAAKKKAEEAAKIEENNDSEKSETKTDEPENSCDTEGSSEEKTSVSKDSDMEQDENISVEKTVIKETQNPDTDSYSKT